MSFSVHTEIPNQGTFGIDEPRFVFCVSGRGSQTYIVAVHVIGAPPIVWPLFAVPPENVDLFSVSSGGYRVAPPLARPFFPAGSSGPSGFGGGLGGYFFFPKHIH